MSEMYCAICGWILGDHVSLTDSNIVLLSIGQPKRLPKNVLKQYALRSTEDGIYEVPGTVAGVARSCFRFHKSTEQIPVYKEPLHDDAQGQPLFIPVHLCCLRIAEKVIKVRSGYVLQKTHHQMVTSKRALWDVLESRYRAALKRTGSSLADMSLSIELNTNYHLPGWNELHFYSHSIKVVLSPQCPVMIGIIWRNANNMKIKNLTEIIFSSLKRLPHIRDVSPSHTALAKRLEGLPGEVMEKIFESLAPFENPPLQCTRLIPNWYWKKGLMNGSLLPYLWDIDSDFLDDRDMPAMAWDYERLVRQLAQAGIWEFWNKFPPTTSLNRQGSSYYCSADSGLSLSGICTRRRIWRLVEEMYVRDAKP